MNKKAVKILIKNIILVSGGFDPIHSGHISLIKECSKLGEVIVLLNSDNWLREKKGKEFLPFSERKIIMNSIKSVIDVISFDDKDKTCINGIKKALLRYPKCNFKFANGGDRIETKAPNQETIFCKNNNIKVLWNVGGKNKKNSSSWILDRWKKLKFKESIKN